MIVSISWREWLVDLHVVRYATEEHARRHVEAMDPERTAYFVDTDSPSPWSELGSYCTRNLVQIANTLNGDEQPDHRTVHHDDALARVADRIVAIAKQREVMDTDTNTETNETGTEGAPSTRSFKPVVLGPFKPVRDGTKLAELLRLAAVGGRTYVQLAEASQLTLAGVSGRLRGGLGRDHGIGHTVDAATGEVVITAPEGKTLDDLIAKPEEKPPTAPRPLVVARELTPVRDGSVASKAIRYAQNGGNDVTLADLGSHLGVDQKGLTTLLRKMARNNGIGHEPTTCGSVAFVAPRGKTLDDLIKAKAEPAPRPARTPRPTDAPKVGAFKPVRPGSRLHSYVKMMDNGGATLSDMAALTDGFGDKDVLWWLKYSLRRDHGIDFAVDGDVYRLVLPDGKTADDCVKAAA